MHAAQHGRVVEHGLEVNGEVVLDDEDGAEEEKQVRSRGPDNALLDHGERDHGSVALLVLPDEEEEKGDSGADDEADDDGAAPRVHGAAVLQCQQEHDCGGADEEEAGEVQGLDGGPKDVSWVRLGGRLGDAG